jgi:putative tricarboxylic transport membrane protein
MLGLMGLALLYMVFRPAPIKHSADEPPLDRETLIKIGICVGLLVFAGTFESLGFILSSHPHRHPDGTPVRRSLAASVVIISLMAIGLYLLFDRLMDVPLPLGLLSVLEN